MNLAISSTGFKEPSYQNVDINSSNIQGFVLPEKLSNIVIHGVFSLMNMQDCPKFLEEIFKRIEVGGKLTIYTIDIYDISHKMHRREMSEGEFNAIMYGSGNKNCLSTMYFIQVCEGIGFKKKTISFENEIWSKMEFIK